MAYHAFVSYGHAVDGKLALALQIPDGPASVGAVDTSCLLQIQDGRIGYQGRNRGGQGRHRDRLTPACWPAHGLRF